MLVLKFVEGQYAQALFKSISSNTKFTDKNLIIPTITEN